MSHAIPSPQDCEFAIVGAGALGSILGAHLARAGHEVIMLARGTRAATVLEHGLRIRGLSEFSVPVRVLTEPGRLRAAQVLIVATKTPGTDHTLHALRHVSVGMALSIQNGVLKNELLSSAFGSACVLGAAADTSGELLADGVVLFTRNVDVLLGELTGHLSPRAQELAARIAAAGVRARAVTDILSVEWSKFAVWAGLVSLSLLTRAATWRYLTDAGCAGVLVRLAREMGALAHAQGIALSDEGVLPAATLVHGSAERATEAVLSVGRRFAAQAPQHRMSSLQDLEAGRALEIHETLGYALQLARAHEIRAPLLESCYALVSVLDPSRSAAAHPSH